MAAKAQSKSPDPRSAETIDASATLRPIRQKTPGVRRAIIETAAKLFAEKGFGGTNLRDIADAQGMSRPGLHYHFPTKKRLLEAIVEEVTLAAQHELELSLSTTTDDPEGALRLLVRQSTLQVIESRVLFKVLDRSEADMSPEMRETNEGAKRAIQKKYVEIIERGILTGRFRPVDPHVAALVISGMRNWTAWWYRPDGRIDAPEIAGIVAEMAVRSLLRPDSERDRNEKIGDALQILRDDVAHLSTLVEKAGLE